MLREFSSFFELFAALNLGYATSKKFRETVNNNILKVKSAISEKQKAKTKCLLDGIRVTYAGEAEREAKKKCDHADRYFNRSVQTIERSAIENSDFPEGARSIFLIVTIYCVYCLLLCGYEQKYPVECKTILLTMNLNIIIIIWLFIRNLLPKSHKTNLNPTLTVLLFHIPFLYYNLITHAESVRYYHFEPNSIEWLATPTAAIIFSLIAFIQHFLRVIMHRTYFRYQLFRIQNRTAMCIRRIEKSIEYVKHLRGGRDLSFKIVLLDISLWVQDLIRTIKRKKRIVRSYY